jgi:hypothetical protein
MLMRPERSLRWSLLRRDRRLRILTYAARRPCRMDARHDPGLAASIVHDFLCRRVGVDAVALLSMATAVVLGESQI